MKASSIPLEIRVLLVVLLLTIIIGVALGMPVTYPICSAEVAENTMCGVNANCIMYEAGVPACTCAVDVATGLTLTGNPYVACTYDISGYWQMFTKTSIGVGGRVATLSPVNNQPFIIRVDHTDTLLSTKYILGAVFAVVGITSFSLNVCNKILIDVRDNMTTIMQYAEGYLNGKGRGMLLRTPQLTTSLYKKHGVTYGIDRWDLTGEWEKESGQKVKIKNLVRPLDWDGFFSHAAKNFKSYWYDDDDYGTDGRLQESVALFHDKTKKVEKVAIDSKATFVQTGWLGLLRFGSRRIDIYSAKNGFKKFTMLQIRDLPTSAFTPIQSMAALPPPPGGEAPTGANLAAQGAGFELGPPPAPEPADTAQTLSKTEGEEAEDEEDEGSPGGRKREREGRRRSRREASGAGAAEHLP
ncbi:unnamed protein product [Vitrella brassicaformis CCMP3155]|uniref:EGF-like domain-containing protein n=2 Tax=Vitrella brassicaformis TaxID=1169539 RepID=A0A0G4F211_VITBC|nr:unnamed protein product [Vitrella brassicaformis CCMP3155]|eukprot:CEM05658.1 unnamed protein product [Vitrella brassicaformis CCMP3155]